VPESNPIDLTKINPNFANRLQCLSPQQKVRAIVLLKIDRHQQLAGKRQSPPERQAAIEMVRSSAAISLAKIEEIVHQYDGKILTDRPDALGAISIEITVAGIDRLVQSESVIAVMEDGSIFRTYRSDR
jgi:hypothetical protein